MTIKKFTCLYCNKEKDQSESSLEHIIPKFMGGNFSPKIFRTNTVCQSCNNKLGLWVDASYLKSWHVTNYLASAARKFWTKLSDPGLPIIFIGRTEIPNINLPNSYVAEQWLGPSGETIIWLRPHDERMDTYAGGNPIDVKKVASVAYYFPVSDDVNKVLLGIRSFHHAMAKRKVRKVLSTTIYNNDGTILDPSLLRFDNPTAEDLENLKLINQAIQSETMKGKFLLDLNFDHRFRFKLALSLGFSLFGTEFLNNPITLKLRQGLWSISDDFGIRGTASLAILNSKLGQLAGYPGAFALTIKKLDDYWVLIVSLDEQLPFTIEIAPSFLSSPYINPEDGYVLLLFPYLEKCVELSLTDLILHKSEQLKNEELNTIDQIQKIVMPQHFLLTLCR